jgi:hypothetical protein
LITTGRSSRFTGKGFDQLESYLKRGRNTGDWKGAVQESLVLIEKLKRDRQALKEVWLATKNIADRRDAQLEDRLDELLGLDNEDNPEGAQ